MAKITQVIDSFIDTMTGIIFDGYAKTGLKGDHTEAREMVREFLVKNEQKLRMWIKTNPGERPPVYFLDEGRKVVWLTRRQRRTKDRMEAVARAKLARALSSRSGPIQKNSKSESDQQTEPPKEAGDESVKRPTADT